MIKLNKLNPTTINVRNASNTMIISGHPCAKICQKLGFSNCRCQEKDNLRNLFIAITILIQRLTPVDWKIFNKQPTWVRHPHRHNAFRYASREEADSEVMGKEAAMDVYLYDEDLYPDFELKDDPFLMILRAKVPIAQLSLEFEIFLKQLAADMPDVTDHRELYDRGYQLRHDPETGLTALRMPDPLHQMKFLQHLASKGCIRMEQHQVLDTFTRLMQARYGGPELRPIPGAPRRRDLVEEMMSEQRNSTKKFNPSPLNTKLQLEPNKK